MYIFGRASLVLLGVALVRTEARLPVVDLGYEIHQAISYNQTIGYYNFSNIRYAAPPLGNLRFATPEAPVVNRGSVQTGSVGRICPQALPAWELLAEEFVIAYLTGQSFNASSVTSSSSSSTSLPPQDPRTSEDCLFLDVLVPKTIFDARKVILYGRPKLAPVLVWIYGGGYTEGEKSTFPGSPAGLLKRSENGVIFVALNYRLGAFGWSSGPSFQASGTANAGLHDQRFALEWIQKYIHLFGGDKDRVTIFGESAGGGSIMHQITAYGGSKGAVPFQAALPQSPGFLPVVSAATQERTFDNFLALLNVSSLEEARKLPSSTLITANIIQVGLESGYGNFTYGPVVDGDFVPALPGQLLLHGQFDHSLRIMTGHNADEGLDFTPYFDLNNTILRQQLGKTFPGISSAALDYILQVLYPPIFDGSLGYTDEIGRAAFIISEVSFTCNTNYLARAYGDHTYAYYFTVPPALHGMDVAYTFYDDTGISSSVENVTVAYVLQEFITSFAINGKPSSRTWGHAIPQYGPKTNIVNLNLTSIKVQRDSTANARCIWWQKGLYY